MPLRFDLSGKRMGERVSGLGGIVCSRFKVLKDSLYMWLLSIKLSQGLNNHCC